MPRSTARVWSLGIAAEVTELTITAPVSGARVSTATFSATWQILPILTQLQYRAQIYSDADGANLVFDTQWVTSAVQGGSLATGSALTSHTTYYLRVFATTTTGESAESVIVPFYFALPTSANITGLVVQAVPTCYPGPRDNPAMWVRWNRITLTETFLCYEIWRRQYGETSYTKIARILNQDTIIYWDANVKPGTIYQYTVVAYGDQISPTQTRVSIPPSPVQAEINFDWVYVHEAEAGSGMTEFFRVPTDEGGDVSVVQPVEIQETWGRQRPTAFYGETFAHKISLNGLDYLRRKPADWERVRRMLERQATAGTTLCLRMGLDREMYFCTMNAKKSLSQKTWRADYEFIEVHFEEDIGMYEHVAGSAP